MSVSSDENLARFIFSKNYFSKTKKTVNFGAFMPPPDSKDLSVFRISSISDNEVWKIGVEEVGGNRNLKARADILVSQVKKRGLQVIPETKSHKFHANITPFPLDKITRQIIATKLADASKLKEMPQE